MFDLYFRITSRCTLVSVYLQSLCFLLQCRGAHQTVTYRGTLIRLVQYPNVLREVGTTIFWFHSLQSPTTFWKCRLNKMLKSHKGDQFYFLQLWTGETWRREKQPRFCSDTDTEKQTQQLDFSVLTTNPDGPTGSVSRRWTCSAPVIHNDAFWKFGLSWSICYHFIYALWCLQHMMTWN